MRTDEHDQIWADNDSIPPHQWERMANLAKAPWKKAPEATKDKGTPWCTETTAGSINYSIRYDYPYFEKHPEEDLPESFCFLAPFSNKTVDSNCMDVAKQAPSMAKRARVEQASKDCVVEKKRQRLESEIEPQGKKKKRKAKPGPLDRREAWYGKAGWREYAGKLVTGLDAHGLKFTLLKDLEQAFENMVKVH